VNHTIYQVNTYLSVIITAYDEEINLKNGALDDVINYLKSQKYSWELILVNDGSTDKTKEIISSYVAKYPQIKLINNSHLGKAAGIISGCLAARGEIILFLDMDQSTPISEFSKLIPQFKSGFGVVIGSRSKREGAPLFRQILAFSMVFLRTLILRLPVRDSQCGFKAFTQKASRDIFTRLKKVHPPLPISYASTNPGFDLEILYLARKLGYKVAEVPVIWHYHESKRVTFRKDAINGLKELFLVRYRSLTNQYK
jgi:dolichyl-phosphate beta-glucosyltransferase